ncbi:MAG: glycosyltransferase family 4 protein [Thermodesulfobacteriota bacterium]
MSGPPAAGGEVPGAVLHIDTGRTWRGGQQQVFYLHRGLLERGVDSRLVCSAGGELLRRCAAQGLPAAGAPLRGEWDVLSAWALARRIRRLRPSLVHAHSSHAQMLALLACRLAGARNLVATRRVDFVPPRHPVNRWKYGGVARWIAISQAIADILRDFGIPEERLRVVPSGVLPRPADAGAAAAFRRELGVAPDQPLVGNIAHLADHKGQTYLVDALQRVLERVPRVRCVIVGQGELEAPLKEQARRLGLGRHLVFTGFRDDVDAIMEALDLFVMSSHLEGLGTIVMDALLAGKPVVATRTGGIPEIIQDGVHGLLVPPRDPAALAEAVLRLLEDGALAARLASAGQERVRNRFGVGAMVQGNLAVYRELLA